MTLDVDLDETTPSDGGDVAAYLRRVGVPSPPPLTVPFDPGYDPLTVGSHIEQSSHLMAALKLSMTCWQIASPDATRSKIRAAKAHGVPLVAGGATFEIAVQRQTLNDYFELCAALGIDCIEAGEGFTELGVTAAQTLRLAGRYGLDVQFELGRKHEGAFTIERVKELVNQGREWLDAGAARLVVEARESALGVGLFDTEGRLREDSADLLVQELGVDMLCFEAPTKPSQFALLKHLGPEIVLSNVRLEELLRVEIFRRGMHADSYDDPKLGAWAAVGSAEGSEALAT
jgi:phosphosulfolactate synthase